MARIYLSQIGCRKSRASNWIIGSDCPIAGFFGVIGSLPLVRFLGDPLMSRISWFGSEIGPDQFWKFKVVFGCFDP